VDIETQTVLVPIGGLAVTLPPGKFTKWHAVHPETAAPNKVKVTKATVNGFTLQVLFQPPAVRQKTVRTMKDVEGTDRQIPDFGLVHPPAVPVEAQVTYRITGA